MRKSGHLVGHSHVYVTRFTVQRMYTHGCQRTVCIDIIGTAKLCNRDKTGTSYGLRCLQRSFCSKSPI